jgi:hypothetical protein
LTVDSYGPWPGSYRQLSTVHRSSTSPAVNKNRFQHLPEPFSGQSGFHVTMAFVRLLAVICTLLLASLSASQVRADSIVFPYSWVKPTTDGRHQFVMIASEPHRQIESYAERDAKLRATYKQSGLYRMGETTSPLYTVDWYSANVNLSDDGRYAVLIYGAADRHEPMTSPALAFYDRGALLREYKVDAFILGDFQLGHSVTMTFWLDEREFDWSRNELSITTEHFATFRFDATSGEIISSFRGDYLILAGLAAGIPLATLMIGLYWRKRRRDRNRRRNR